MNPRALGFETTRVFVRDEHSSETVPYDLLADVVVRTSDVPGAVQCADRGGEGKERESGELHSDYCDKVFWCGLKKYRA